MTGPTRLSSSLGRSPTNRWRCPQLPWRLATGRCSRSRLSRIPSSNLRPICWLVLTTCSSRCSKSPSLRSCTCAKNPSSSSCIAARTAFFLCSFVSTWGVSSLVGFFTDEDTPFSLACLQLIHTPIGLHQRLAADDDGVHRNRSLGPGLAAVRRGSHVQLVEVAEVVPLGVAIAVAGAARRVIADRPVLIKILAVCCRC